MEGSPQLQYQAELGIAGLVDRPPSVLSVSERLHLVKSHQLRMNRPQTCFERRNILWPQRRGVVKVAGDLLLQAYDRTLPTHQPHAVYNTVDIGLAHSLLFGDDEPIEWWTFRFDYHFSRFYVDPSQDLVVLVETAAGRPPSIP